MSTAVLSPKQRTSILEADAPVNIWEGAVRSGKTLASIVAFLDRIARRQPGLPGRIVIIGRTMDTIYRNVMSGVIELLGPASDGIRYTRGANTAVIFGREVDVIGASDARSEARIRGMTIAIAYVDELTLLPDLGYWEQLLNRQITVADAVTFATTNPDNPMHWAKVDVIDRCDELGWRTWKFLLDDNPILTDEAKAAAAARNRGLYYARNILGEWVLAEGVIWDMWDGRKIADGGMVYSDLEQPDISDWVVSIDPGAGGVFSAHLTGLGADDKLYVAAELRFDHRGRQASMTDVDFSRALTAWLDELDPATNAIPSRCPGARSPWRTIIDPSGVSLRTQLKRDGWDMVRDADNAVVPGIRMVGSLLGDGRIRVHESCTGLLGEIPGYCWDPKAAMVGVDKPIKVNDHSCDDMRYMVTGTTRWWRHWLSPE